MKNDIHSIALRSLLVAVALVLSWMEAQIPYFFAVPGMKLGLTNLVIMIALYKLSEKDAILLNIVRILIVAFTFGNAFSMMYSIAGAVLSFLTMVICKRYTSLNMMAVSIAGGIMHNVGQIIVAMFVLDNSKILWYLPFLWASGIVAGAVIGIISGQVIKRLPEIKA